jgi:hypothetical protein
MRKTLHALIAVVAMASTMGCHAQAPVTQHAVDLAWTAPVPVSGQVWQTACGTGTNQAPCTYLISRATVASGGPCPAPAPTSGSPTTYTALNAASPATGLTYADASSGGAIYCYIAQAIQNGSTGGASNVVGPLTVPANPGQPVMSNATVAQLEGKPAVPAPPAADPQVASEQKPVLTAHVR